MVPFEAFSTEAPHSSSAFCSGCEGGTQCASFSSKVLSCAIAPLAQSANAATSKAVLSCMNSSLWSALSRRLLRIDARVTASGKRDNCASGNPQLGDHLVGNGLRLDLAGVRRIADHPHARLKRLDGERAVLLQMMGDVEAGTLRFGHAGFDRHIVAEAARNEKARTRIDHWVASKLVNLEQLILGEPGGGREHRGGGSVEHFEVTRIEHDAGGIAFTPLDAALGGVGAKRHFGAMRNEPSIRITSPLR